MSNQENSIGNGWQSSGRGSGLFRSRGSFRQRQNYGLGRYSNIRRDEHVISEFKFLKTEETLLRENILLQEPCEVAYYSKVASGGVYWDDRNLRHIKRNISQDIGADLNQGFGTFIPKRVVELHGFGHLLACIRNKNIPLQDIRFVTFRNNLNKILATAYIRHEPWEMGVHKRNGAVYLDVHQLPERQLTELDRRRCYWGLSF